MENGKMISNMDKEKKFYHRSTNTSENLHMGKNMVLERLNSLMGPSTLDISKKVK